MTLNELKEFIAQQAEKFHAIENIEEWQWELVEFGTFNKIFDFVVANGYFQPSKEQLEEIEGEGWSLISAMEAVDEQKKLMPPEIKEMIGFFYQSFFPENEENDS